jgi:hypothetical protein
MHQREQRLGLKLKIENSPAVPAKVAESLEFAEMIIAN